MKSFSCMELPGTARSTERTLAMVLCGLAVLLMVASCNKDAVNHKIEGNWRLVEYTGNGSIVRVNADTSHLSLNPDHTYKLETGALMSSGTYQLIFSTGAPRETILQLSGIQYGIGYNVEFARDTLVLKWRGIYTDLQPMLKYVRR